MTIWLTDTIEQNDGARAYFCSKTSSRPSAKAASIRLFINSTISVSVLAICSLQGISVEDSHCFVILTDCDAGEKTLLKRDVLDSTSFWNSNASLRARDCPKPDEVLGGDALKPELLGSGKRLLVLADWASP